MTECGHELAGEGLELIVGQRDEVDLVGDIPQDLVDADGERNQLALSQICSQRTKTGQSQQSQLPENLPQTMPPCSSACAPYARLETLLSLF